VTRTNAPFQLLHQRRKRGPPAADQPPENCDLGKRLWPACASPPLCFWLFLSRRRISQRGEREVEPKALNPIIETVETSGGFQRAVSRPPMKSCVATSGRSVGNKTLGPQYAVIWTSTQRLFFPATVPFGQLQGLKSADAKFVRFLWRTSQTASDCGLTSLATECTAAVSS